MANDFQRTKGLELLEYLYDEVKNNSDCNDNFYGSRIPIFNCDDMSKEPIPHVVYNLVGCAVSLSAFYIVTDLNTKLALLQHINKEYHSLAHKLEDGNISTSDLDLAAPAAKEKISTEIQRRDDFGLDAEAVEKLSKSSPSKVDQIINFLKQKRIMEIHTSLSFKEPKVES